MSKEKGIPPVTTGSSLIKPICGYGYVISEWVPNDIIGRILTLIEVIGLREEQEKSLKDLIRQVMWESIDRAIFIKPERHQLIRDEYLKKKKEASIQGNHISAI